MQTGLVAEESKTAATETWRSASESLSQLIARILEQLALSAWLPSSALTLLLVFVMEMGAAIDGPAKSGSKSPVFAAFDRMGGYGITNLLLMMMCMVALTMLTQAFTFESIRVLEGYWGVGRVPQALARLSRKRWKRHQRRLCRSRKRVIKEALKRAEKDLLAQDGMTPEMVTVLRDQVLERESVIELETEALDRLDLLDWRRFAPGSHLHHLVAIEYKLADFPGKKHVMPTRLGNVLRHFEDAAGEVDVESLVEARFESLPASLQISHDEQRGRLDLYCSMVLVMVLVGVVGLLRMLMSNWLWGVGVLLTCLLLAVICYRAAIASARYYGALLVRISDFPIVAPHATGGVSAATHE